MEFEALEKISIAMNIEKTLPRSFQRHEFTSAPRFAKKERSFELTLPAVVNGVDAAGKKFEERTEIHSISSQETSFQLLTRLMIGAKVLLSLEIPRTLILEKPLRLFLSGTIVFVKSEDSRGKRQFISARLDRTFRLLSDS